MADETLQKQHNSRPLKFLPEKRYINRYMPCSKFMIWSTMQFFYMRYIMSFNYTDRQFEYPPRDVNPFLSRRRNKRLPFQHSLKKCLKQKEETTRLQKVQTICVVYGSFPFIFGGSNKKGFCFWHFFVIKCSLGMHDLHVYSRLIG